jgi:hypothetical protein
MPTGRCVIKQRHTYCWDKGKSPQTNFTHNELVCWNRRLFCCRWLRKSNATMAVAYRDCLEKLKIKLTTKATNTWLELLNFSSHALFKRLSAILAYSAVGRRTSNNSLDVASATVQSVTSDCWLNDTSFACTSMCIFRHFSWNRLFHTVMNEHSNVVQLFNIWHNR